MMTVDAFLAAFSAWAATRPDIRAVALVGSQARGTAEPDSDVDFVILTDNSGQYLEDRRWLSEFGPARDAQLEDYGAVVSLRVFYDEGPEVEFGFATPDWATLPLDSGTRDVLSAGMRVLYDPQGLLSRLAADL